MHFSCRLYLIILLTEVKDMLHVMYFAAVSLWLPLLAKCKIFNILCDGRNKYLSSTVNLIIAKQIYMTSKLCHQYQRILIPYFTNLCTAKI